MKPPDFHTQAATALVSRIYWKWIQGMETTCHLRLLERTDPQSGDNILLGYRTGVDTKNGGGCVEEEIDGHLPNLRDAATIGCIEARLQDVWGPSISFINTEKGWAMKLEGGAIGIPEMTLGRNSSPYHPSKLEALLIAFEASDKIPREGVSSP